jgi:hypothetical protein
VGQVAVHLRAVEPPLISHTTDQDEKRVASWGSPMLSFQLIGWVLILLFFGAMIGGHKGIADR